MANTDVTQAMSSHIASRNRTWLSFDGMTLWLPNPDPILKALGRDISTYRDLLSDSLVGGNTRRRRAAVLAMEHGLDRANASARVFKFVENAINRLKMRQIISGLHDAAWYGYQPAEIMWDTHQGWTPKAVISKPPEWFLFDTDNQLRFRSKNAWEGELLPDRKFLLATNDATYDNPYGMPELSRVFWPITFKKGGLKFWLRFADKYGQGFLIGKHPRGTEQTEIDALLDSLEQMAQDGVAAIPDDSSVELKESAGKSASADLFERLLMYCRSEVNIALLGQNQSTESSSTKASASAGNEVADDIRDGDACIIESAINQLIRWIVDLNFGEDEAAPTWSMWEQEQVDEVLAKRDQALTQAGAKFTPAYFKRSYNLQDGDLDESITPPITTDFAENLPVLDYTEQHTSQLAKQAQPKINAWLKRLNTTMQKVESEGGSLADLEQRLLLEFSELPIDDLTNIMGLAFSAASLAGRAEVQEEST